MQSWWDLGEGSGYPGSEFEPHDITCAFCSDEGKFALEHRSKKKNSAGKTLNYDIYKCENCANLTMVLWSASRNMHGRRVMPWPMRIEKHPEAWPKDVGRFWIQAKRGQADRNWDSAAVMARSSLQLALRHKGAEGKDLFHEIDDLATKGELPPLMRDWSHEIRMLARDPAHPKPGQEATSQRDVADIINFLEYLLQYLFSLPTSIAEFRSRK